MKKLLVSTALTLGLFASQAQALTCQGTVWSRAGYNASIQTSAVNAAATYCLANITSGTTSTQIGRLQIIPPGKQIVLTLTASGTAVANLVTPTVTYYLGNTPLVTQNVSVSTAGNVVITGANGIPYYTSLGVSVSVPSTISSTNSVLMGVFENTRP